MSSPVKMWALGLFLLFAAFSPGRLISVDTGLRLSVTRQIWRHGSFHLNEREVAGNGLVPNAGDGLLVRVTAGRTTFYGIGQSLVFVPFDMVGAVLGSFGGERAALLPLLFLYAPL